MQLGQRGFEPLYPRLGVRIPFYQNYLLLLEEVRQLLEKLPLLLMLRDRRRGWHIVLRAGR